MLTSSIRQVKRNIKYQNAILNSPIAENYLYIFTFMKILHNLTLKNYFRQLLPLVFQLMMLSGFAFSQEQTDGKTDWSLPFKPCPAKISEAANIATVASDNGSQLFIATSSGDLRSYDILNGRHLWDADLGSAIVSNLIFDEKYGFAASKREGDAANLTIRAISKLTGITIWQKEFPYADKVFIARSEDSLIVATKNYVNSFDSNDGSENWRVGNKLDVIDFQGDFEADRSQEKVRSEIENSAQIIELEGFETGFLTELSYGENSLLIGDKFGGIYSYSLSNLKLDWKAKTGGEISSLTRINGSHILVGSFDNFLYMYGAESGNMKWKRRLPFRVTARPLIIEKTALIAGVGSDRIYFVNLENGKTINQISLPENVYVTGNISAFEEGLAIPTNIGVYAFLQGECRK